MTNLTAREAALLAQLPLSVSHLKTTAQHPDIGISPSAFLARMRVLRYAIAIGGTVVRTRAGDRALATDILEEKLDRAGLAALVQDYRRDHAEEIAEAAHRRKVRLLSYLRGQGRA